MVQSSVEEQFNQAMEVMWQKYQGLMAERLEVLQTAATAIKTGQIADELRLAASKEAHKLAGVLGMFEWESGTKIAKEIEQILESDRLLLETKVLSLIEDLDKGIKDRGQGQSKAAWARTAQAEQGASSNQGRAREHAHVLPLPKTLSDLRLVMVVDC